MADEFFVMNRIVETLLMLPSNLTIMCLNSSWLEKDSPVVAFARFVNCIKEKLRGKLKEKSGS